MQRKKLRSALGVLAVILVSAAPAFGQEASNPSSTRVRPTSIYGQQFGSASREDLRRQLKELRVNMAVLKKAAAVLDENPSEPGKAAIIHNLIQLKILSDFAKALPLVATRIETTRWDIWLAVDSCEAECERLESKAQSTKSRIDALVEAILDEEEKQGSEIKINTLKGELEQRMDQHDAQTRDAAEAKRIAGSLRQEVGRLKSIDDLLDGIAHEKAVYAERLLEGIEREVSISMPKGMAEEMQQINVMIGIVANEKDDESPKVRRSVGQVPLDSVASEVDALKAATKVKDEARINAVLDKARAVRQKK